MTAYLYIMDRGDARKIGYSVDPRSRRCGVSSDWDCDVSLVAAFTYDGEIQDAERAAHKVLADFRDRGEWFKVSVETARDAILSIGAVECEIPRLSRGAGPKAFRFSPEELELLERIASQYDSYKDAVMAGLRKLEEGDEPSNAALLRMLKERLAG